MKAATDCFVDRSQVWFVVARDQQFELRQEFEEVLSINRAEILSPPVSVLIFASAQRRPSSVSVTVTRRAPRRPARSVG